MSAEKDSYTPEVHARWMKVMSYASRVLLIGSGAAIWQFTATPIWWLGLLSFVLFALGSAADEVVIHEFTYTPKDPKGDVAHDT